MDKEDFKTVNSSVLHSAEFHDEQPQKTEWAAFHTLTLMDPHKLATHEEMNKQFQPLQKPFTNGGKQPTSFKVNHHLSLQTDSFTRTGHPINGETHAQSHGSQPRGTCKRLASNG